MGTKTIVYHYNKNVDFEITVNHKKLKKIYIDEIISRIFNLVDNITDELDTFENINHPDDITKWIIDHVETGNNYKIDKIRCSELYDLFSNHIQGISKQKFNKRMYDNKFIRDKINGIPYWRYIKYK